ncbi:MAG: hypothetical protein Q9226_003874 [Calogaya cf. arnoldii]
MPNGLNAPPLRCNRLPYWQPNTIRHGDCIQALELFRTAEGAKPGSQSFEFLTPGAHKVSTLLPLWTPRVYSAGTCTIAVVMLAGLPPNFLPPGAILKVWPPIDIETLDELRNAAANIVRTCVYIGGGFPKAGWVPKGRLNGSIGVLLYETGSLMDRIVRNERGLYVDGVANQSVEALTRDTMF